MIRHIVLVRCGADVDATILELEKFCENFEGIMGFAWGPNSSIEPKVEHGFKRAFVVDFRNSTDRDRYVSDPGHQAIGGKLVSMCPGGLDDIIVFDLELADNEGELK